jgi:hypothetical protein
MNRLVNSFTAAALMSAIVTAFAQNPVADYKADASGAVESRQPPRSRANSAVRAPHSGSAVPAREVEERNDRGAAVPSEQGIVRGGPENPSGLKKPD